MEDTVLSTEDNFNRTLAKYSDELQKIYEDRTAGDRTFSGVLASFGHELIDILTDDLEV